MLGAATPPMAAGKIRASPGVRPVRGPAATTAIAPAANNTRISFTPNAVATTARMPSTRKNEVFAALGVSDQIACTITARITGLTPYKIQPALGSDPNRTYAQA